MFVVRRYFGDFMLPKALPLSLIILLAFGNLCCAQECNKARHDCGNACQSSQAGCNSNCCNTVRRRGDGNRDITAQLNAAAEACRRGEYELAANCYKFVLEKDPRNREALYNVGKIAEQNGQRQEADRFFQLAAVYSTGNLSTTYYQPPCPDLCIANKKSNGTGKKILKFMARAGVVALEAAAAVGSAYAANNAYYGNLYGGGLGGYGGMSGLGTIDPALDAALGCPVCESLR